VKFFLNFFGALFFYGCLSTATCTIEMAQIKGLNGHCAVSTTATEYKAHIRILQRPDLDRKARFMFYLGIVLHEMIHFFIDVYAVEQASHGYTFFDLAIGIEDLLLVDLGFDLDLGVDASLVWELVEDKSDSPMDVTRWGYSAQQIWAEVADLRESIRHGAVQTLNISNLPFPI